MKIFIQEIKKILRPVPLLALTALVGLYSFAYFRDLFYIYPRETVFADLVEIVGPKVNPDNPQELMDAVISLEERYHKQFEEEIKTIPGYVNAGITNHDEYYELLQKRGNLYLQQEIEEYGFTYEEFDMDADYTLTPREEAFFERGVMWSAPSLEKINIIDDLLRQVEYFVEAGTFNRFERFYDIDNPDYVYDYAADLRDWWGIDPAGIERIREIYSSGEILNILPEVYPGYVFYHLIVIILATVFILLAPVVTKDNMSGVRGLQYSSKTGRKTLAIQLAAILFSAFVLVAVQVTVVFGIYLSYGWSAFANSGLHSVFKFQSYNWFSGTYLQYFILVGLLFLVVSLAITLFIFIFSKLSRNYITLLLSTVPTVIVIFAFSMNLFRDPFAVLASDGFTFYRMFPIPFVEVYICVAMLIFAAIPAVVMLVKQRRAEI